MRRLLVATFTAVLLAIPAAAQAHRAVDVPVSPLSGSWACVAIKPVDLGVCQGDPIPDDLPIPKIPL